jgi:hypothetical protein
MSTLRQVINLNPREDVRKPKAMQISYSSLILKIDITVIISSEGIKNAY